jgi:amino acid transporter
MVAAVLHLFRSIYAEVGTALPLNGGAYNALLNTTSKGTSSIAACLTLLSYVATAVISGYEAMHYAHTLWHGLDVFTATICLLGFFALLSIVGITESSRDGRRGRRGLRVRGAGARRRAGAWGSAVSGARAPRGRPGPAAAPPNAMSGLASVRLGIATEHPPLGIAPGQDRHRRQERVHLGGRSPQPVRAGARKERRRQATVVLPSRA